MRPTATSLARASLAAGAVSILVTSIVGGAAAATVFVASVALFPAALIVLGAARGERLGAVGWIAAALALLLEGSALGLVLLGQTGWPAAALMLVGLGLAPLLLVTWGYAATFEDTDRSRD